MSRRYYASHKLLSLFPHQMKAVMPGRAGSGKGWREAERGSQRADKACHIWDSHIPNSVSIALFFLLFSKKKDKGGRDGSSCFRIKISQPVLIPSLTPKEWK